MHFYTKYFGISFLLLTDISKTNPYNPNSNFLDVKSFLVLCNQACNCKMSVASDLSAAIYSASSMIFMTRKRVDTWHIQTQVPSQTAIL